VVDLKSSIAIKTPEEKIHPIWTYYVYTTNIYNTMRRLLRTLLVTNNVFSLTPVEDKNEINLLLETLTLAYPTPKTTIMSEFSYEQLLLNMFHRNFGFYSNPNLKYPRSQTYNSRFKTVLESIFLNIAQAVWSQGSSFQLLEDPAALSENLNDLKSMLISSQTNTQDWLNRYWVDIFDRLLSILDQPKLMKEKLGIVEVGRDKILIALGGKFGIPVPGDTLYRFDLANYLNTFLNKTEKTDWDINAAADLYKSTNFFKLLFSAYSIVEKRDFKREVQFIVPRGPTIYPTGPTVVPRGPTVVPRGPTV
jgi:hypothetical protein